MPKNSSQVIVVTGASSGFGAMTARTLADAGHTVWAGMRDIGGHNADAAREAQSDGSRSASGGSIQPVEMDVSDQDSVDAAVAAIITGSGRIDVVVHNAGHMVLGPTEAFTPEDVEAIFDVNVLSTQRVNRAVLPHLRAQRDGLLVWVGSSSARGGTPPYLAPYFAAKAAEDSLAVSYAAELSRFGIDTFIIVPGSYTTGTNHFAHAGHPSDAGTVAEYDREHGGLMDEVSDRLRDLSPADADPAEIAREIARVVDLPKGRRPFRVTIDPADDGAAVVYAVGDRIRREFYHRIGFPELLQPSTGSENDAT